MIENGSMIYVTTSGKYSDYMITGVFGSREDAEEYLRIYRVSSPYPYAETENPIEAYEVGKLLSRARRGRQCYTVRMIASTGALYDIDVRKDEDDDFNFEETQWEFRLYDGETVQPDKDLIEVRCWARDQNHAMKIAVEKRQEWLRTRP